MNEDLSNWVSEWQSMGCQTDEVVKKAKAIRFTRRLAVALGLLVAVCFAVGCGYCFVHETHLVNKAVLAFTSLLTLFIMAMHVYHEWTLKDVDCQDDLAVVKQFRERIVKEVAIGQSWWVFAFLIGFLSAWVPWKLSVDWAMYAKEPQLAYWGVGGILAISLFTFVAQVYSTRRAQRSVIALSEVIDELNSKTN